MTDSFKDKSLDEKINFCITNYAISVGLKQGKEAMIVWLDSKERKDLENFARKTFEESK